jgi:methyltransferase-like protein/2-polyprenyl-3-methyl-5-hydroxy-6-metoxy-1,4-benzoquinol methylase
MSISQLASDALPAGHLPLGAAQPETLEVLGYFRSLRPVPARRARVLELGCGAGENLLPLADRYPEARFVGIEPLPRQIELARQIAQTAGLANVDFHSADFGLIDRTLGAFDYVLVPRAYLRGDPATREHLLADCRDHLAPEGIACISYHARPGCALHDSLRDMMRYEARAAINQAQAIAEARKLLAFLQASLVQDQPYDMMVRAEIGHLAKLDDATLWRDHLAAPGSSVSFAEFVDQSKRCSLRVAGDAAVGIRYSDSLWPTAERQLESLDADEVSRELFRDVLKNRTLRHTLLVHQAVNVSQALRPEPLAGLYFEGALVPESAIDDLCSAATAYFVGPDMVRTSTASPLVKAALLHLGKAWPAFVRFEELIEAACARYDKVSPNISTADDVARLKDNLMHLAAGGSIRLHTGPPDFALRAGDKPLASALVRLQARSSGPVVNRRHEAVALDPFDRALLAVLDGTRNRDQLVAHLAAEVSDRRLVVVAAEKPLETREEAERTFSQALPDALARLARSGLVVG